MTDAEREALSRIWTTTDSCATSAVDVAIVAEIRRAVLAERLACLAEIDAEIGFAQQAKRLSENERRAVVQFLGCARKHIAKRG